MVYGWGVDWWVRLFGVVSSYWYAARGGNFLLLSPVTGGEGTWWGGSGRLGGTAREEEVSAGHDQGWCGYTKPVWLSDWA
jgi:hypothetical protein